VQAKGVLISVLPTWSDGQTVSTFREPSALNHSRQCGLN